LRYLPRHGALSAAREQLQSAGFRARNDPDHRLSHLGRQPAWGFPERVFVDIDYPLSDGLSRPVRANDLLVWQETREQADPKLWTPLLSYLADQLRPTIAAPHEDAALPRRC
jgi:hypothetical protein